MDEVGRDASRRHHGRQDGMVCHSELVPSDNGEVEENAPKPWTRVAPKSRGRSGSRGGAVEHTYILVVVQGIAFDIGSGQARFKVLVLFGTGALETVTN